MINTDIFSLKKLFGTGTGILFFLLISLITFLSVGSMNRVNKSVWFTERISELRVPTSEYSLTMINGINGALANLRGWMLIGDERFRIDRKRVWKEDIQAPLQAMQNISKQWTDPVNIARLERIKKLIPKFEKFQQEIENIAQSKYNTPVLTILAKEAVPLADRVNTNINQLMQLENGLPASRERKVLQGSVSGMGHSFTLCMADLRTFLVLADKKSKIAFHKGWTENQKWFDILMANQNLFTPEQQSAYDILSRARTNFYPLANQMITMREATDWNLSVYWLKTRAAPLGRELISLLQEMAQSQKNLLHGDVSRIARVNRLLKFFLWGLFVIGVVLAVFLARYISSEKMRQIELKETKDFLDAISECYGLKETCDVSLQRLAKDHDAVHGLLYYFKKSTGRLHLGGLYGTKPDKEKSTISIGDGVLGQTFANKMISQIDFAKVGASIDTGSLSVMPKQLLTFPLFYNHASIGVAQFTCLKEHHPSEIARMERKLSTTARFIHDAIQEEKTRRLLELLDQRIITSSTDIDGTITQASTAFASISGYTKEEMIGNNHRLLRHPDMDAELFETLWQDISSGKDWQGEIKNLTKNGEYCWVDEWISPDFDLYGNITGYTAVCNDITDKKKIEEISITDSLTGIRNRRYFDTVFQHQLDLVRRERKQLAFAMMDIDYFKPYNDNYGHQMGDKALKRVAKSLKGFENRPDDYVFRLGGEEFGILFSAEKLENARQYAQRINKAVYRLQIPHEHSKTAPYITISMGLILISPDASLDADTLYRETDQLLYQAKEAGRNQLVCRKSFG